MNGNAVAELFPSEADAVIKKLSQNVDLMAVVPLPAGRWPRVVRGVPAATCSVTRSMVR